MAHMWAARNRRWSKRESERAVRERSWEGATLTYTHWREREKEAKWINNNRKCEREKMRQTFEWHLVGWGGIKTRMSSQNHRWMLAHTFAKLLYALHVSIHISRSATNRCLNESTEQLPSQWHLCAHECLHSRLAIVERLFYVHGFASPNLFVNNHIKEFEMLMESMLDDAQRCIRWKNAHRMSPINAFNKEINATPTKNAIILDGFQLFH